MMIPSCLSLILLWGGIPITVHSFTNPSASIQKHGTSIILRPTQHSRSFMSSGLDDDKGTVTTTTMEDVTSMVKSVTDINIDTDIIRANVMEGEVGQRGEAFTAGTLFLLFCILIGGVPISFFNNLFLFLGGPGLMLAGAGIALASLVDLTSDNLTPFSKPVEDGKLIQDGLYSKVRHPIYAGLIAFATGFSILTGSATRLVLTAFLILLLDLKSSREEEYLEEKYPADYPKYKATVTGKLFPRNLFRGSDN